VPRRWPAWAPDGLALAALVLLALIFFWPLSLGRGWIPQGGGDLVSFLWPTYSYAAQALHTGRIPLWNPSLYSGAPFAADNQSGFFYPINLVVFLLWPSLPYVAVEWLVVFHVWLAGAGMYGLMRVVLPPAAGLGQRLAPPLAAALAFMFSDVFVTHIGNLNIIAVSAWLPLTFAALHLSLIRRSWPWAAAAGAGLGVAALAGHAQMTLIVAGALALYALWQAALAGFETAGPAAQRARQWLAPLASLIILIVVAVGVSALALLPAAQLAAYTGRARLDYAAAAEYSLPWAGLAGLFSPLVFGRGAAAFWGGWPRVELGYAGALTLLLAALAPYRGLNRLPLFLAGLAVFGLLVALGQNTPVHYMLYRLVPGFAQLRVPARFILLTDFGLAGLAGFGLARLGELGVRRIAGAALAVAVIGLLVVLAGFLATPGHAAHWGQLLLGLGVLLGALVIGALLLRTAPRAAALACLLLLAVDLVGQGAGVEIDAHDPTLGYDHPAAVAYLLAQPGPTRLDSAAGAWAPDAAARLGLEDIGGISNPLSLAAYETYAGAVGARGTPLYNFLNAQFVLADKGQPPGDSSLVPIFNDDPSLDIYLNTNAQPRVHLIYRAELVSGGAAAFGALHAPQFDPSGAVVLDTNVAAPAPPALDGSGARAAGERNLFYTNYAPESQTIVAQTPAPAYLVLSEVWYPGWRAWVDGIAVPIYPADLAFRAIYLAQPGQHTVTLRFDPPIWKIGLAITTATLLVLAVWACLGVLRRWRR
jgi:hypothetical protein